MLPKLIILLVVLFLANFTFSQTAIEKQPSDDREKLRKEAVAFMREAIAEVNTMRSLENRISFMSDMAAMMWFHDEKEARAMFTSLMNDFRELLLKYDAQMNEMNLNPSEMGEHFGGFLSRDTSDKARLMRKFTAALAVRQQIALSIAEHDGELAFNFYNDSLSPVSNEEFRRQLESRDTHFEYQLAAQIAEKNAAKATQFAKRTLADGVNFQHVDLLRKIHEKDQEKGAELAAAILSRLKEEKGKVSDIFITSSFLSFAGESYENSKKAGGKKPALDREEVRELADMLGQAVLAGAGDEYFGMSYLDSIEKYAPSRAAQIKAKYKEKPVNPEVSNLATNWTNMNTGGMTTVNANTSTELAREEKEKAAMDEVLKLGTKQLPKEEREKVIGQARRIIAQTPGRDKKIAGLSALAAQVARVGDKELATDIMKDAAALVNPAPKSYEDYLYTWMLATGYAQAEADKAFSLLEDTIGRANQTIEAFVKVGEFIDVAEEMIVDGEVQVGVFGGQMVRGLTKELGIAESTIEHLIKKDFAKTKNLTNRFDRLEVRILAKMLVLRAALSADAVKEPSNDDSLAKPITTGIMKN